MPTPSGDYDDNDRLEALAEFNDTVSGHGISWAQPAPSSLVWFRLATLALIIERAIARKERSDVG